MDDIPLINTVPRRDNTDPVADEARRLRRLRLTFDLVGATLAQQTPLSEHDAQRLIEGARKTALHLFPDAGDTFDLIIRPRLNRILRERGFES